jgi:hypothetical protein
MTTRHLTCLALSIATSCALSACKSTPARPDVLTLPQPAIARPVQDLLLDPNPGVVARVRLGAWSELAPTLGEIARRAPDARLRGVSDALTSGGPLAALDAAGVDGLPDPSLVDRDRPAWLHVGAVASDATWGLLDLGVSLISPFQPISAWRVVALVPSSDPEQLASQLASGPLEARPEGSFVRVVWTQAVVGLSDAPDAIAAAGAPRAPRMTPALVRLLTTDSAASIYVRPRDVRLLAASHALADTVTFLAELAASAPFPPGDDPWAQRKREMAADRLHLSARALLDIARVLSFSPRAVAEFEDHVISLGGDAGAEAAFLDVVSTRTAFGRQVQAAGASATGLTLPSFADAAFPNDRLFFDASFNFDAAAVDATYLPVMRALGGGEPLALDPDDGGVLHQLRNPLAALSLLANSPAFLHPYASRIIGSDLGDARARAARVRLIRADGAVPLGAAVAIAFAGETSLLEEFIKRLEEELSSDFPDSFAIDWTRGAEGGGLLTMSFNLNAAAFAPATPVPAGQGALTFDASPLGALSPDARALGELGVVRVQALPGAYTSTVRVSLSSEPSPATPAPDYVFDAVTNPHPCVDRIHVAALRFDDAMDKVTPENRPEVFGPYAAAIDACAAEVESPLWALARSRASWFPVTYGTDHDAMVSAYSEACEAGDELGCAGEAYLERVGPPRDPNAPLNEPAAPPQ